MLRFRDLTIVAFLRQAISTGILPICLRPADVLELASLRRLHFSLFFYYYPQTDARRSLLLPMAWLPGWLVLDHSRGADH